MHTTPNKRRGAGAATAAIVALLAACGGGSFERDDAVARLVDEAELTEIEANCTVDALAEEVGDFDMLENPDDISEDEAAILGDALLGCLTPAAATSPAPAEEAEATQPPAEEGEAEVATPAEPLGAAGDWTASQLCALMNGDDLGAAFGTVATPTPMEDFEDPSQSICSWPDPDSPDVVPPTLVRLIELESTGELFIDGVPVDVPGADEVDYREAWLPGEDFLVVTAGGRELTVRWVTGTAGALDLAIAAASEWATRQAGG